MSTGSLTGAGSSVGELFDATHAQFRGWFPRLWGPLGEITAAVARPGPGDRVLDACCGSGASALPAAVAVGAQGRVDAVDLAGVLLDQGRRAAEERGLRQVRFVQADVTTYRPDGPPYDVVMCGYGIFFFPDLDAGAQHLVSMLRPGGRLVVSTWQEGGMDSLVALAKLAATGAGDGSAAADDPRRRVDSPDRLQGWLSSLGLVDVRVQALDFRQPLHPQDAWNFVLGAAPRRFVTGLDGPALDRVRDRFWALMDERGVTHLDASSLIGSGCLGC